MPSCLNSIYDQLASIRDLDPKRLAFTVTPHPDLPGCYVGKDTNDCACLLVEVDGQEARNLAPIRLESLDVRLDVRAVVKNRDQVSEANFAVIRCRSHETELIRYFLSVGETILQLIGRNRTRMSIANAVNRLAAIFQKLREPPTRSVNGLFGELFLIRECRSPKHALGAWRPSEKSRFDFSSGDIRIDVKTTSGRRRVHTFSYEQCNPPPGTIAIAASLFAERAASGLSLGELVQAIELSVIGESDLILKLHENVSETLGNSISESLRVQFDERLAAGSLRFFDLRAIPAIRGEIPAGISEIHFCSDLSMVTSLAARTLADESPSIMPFLPNQR